jgi:hypothetical protein
MMRPILLASFLFGTSPGHAQGCLATPEAAAIAIIGGTGPAPVGGGTSGYRVQDVRADPLMQRVWVRVSHCGDASAPLVLVPVRATLAGAPPPLQPPSLLPSTVSHDSAVSQPPANAIAAISVHAGDAVTAVFVSANVHMEMDATANGQAAIGSPVEITLARRGDELPHRMRGVLRASGRVEVQP